MPGVEVGQSTVGGLGDVQPFGEDAGVMVAPPVSGGGVVGFDGDQEAGDARFAERLEDRIRAQTLHAKSARHGMRCDAEAAQFPDLEDGFSQRPGVRYLLGDVEHQQIAFGCGHFGAGDDLDPVGGGKFQRLERTGDLVMVGDSDNVQPSLPDAFQNGRYGSGAVVTLNGMDVQVCKSIFLL